MDKQSILLKLFVLLGFIKICICGTALYNIPPSSPTRHQFIAGIGVPLNLKNEAITYGWTLKAQYFLPETIDQLKFQFFPDIWGGKYNYTFLFDKHWQRFPNGRRKREVLIDPLSGQRYEKYESDVKLIGNSLLHEDDEETDEFEDEFEEDIEERKMMELWQKNENQKEKNSVHDEDLEANLKVSRWNIYDAFARTLESKGLDGRICVLRAICEAAHTEFSHETLMGELFHVFFTPSTTSEPIEKSSDYDYFKAEMIGKEKTDDVKKCAKVFHKCKQSIMEIFTEVFEEIL